MIYMNNCEGALVDRVVRTICMKKDNLRTITLMLDFFCVIIQVGNNTTIMQITEYI